MEGISQIKDILSLPKNITLVSHRNPDGDALGSCLALAHLLDKLGHSCKVIVPSEYPPLFYFLPGVDKILISDEEEESAVKNIENAELIICLDFNSLERVDKLAPSIQESTVPKILIDHHVDPEPFADYYLCSTQASSTCELIFEFIQKLEYEREIDIPVGECLLTGIITDTGSFKHNTNPKVYSIAGQLKELGVDDYKIQDRIFNSLNEKQLRLLGHCLKSRMEVLPEMHTGIIALNKYDFKFYQIQRGDTEGIINYLMMIKNVSVAVFVRQQPTVIKLSFRSKGEISVQQLARDHFNGGGHKNAAGGYFYGSLSDALEKVRKVIPKYLEPNFLTNT